MATKNISITEDAYERLRQLRHQRESFSEIIARLTNKQNLLEFAGILSEESARKLGGSVRKFRGRLNRDLRRRARRIAKQLR